jgi:hypothetical protein
MMPAPENPGGKETSSSTNLAMFVRAGTDIVVTATVWREEFTILN